MKIIEIIELVICVKIDLKPLKCCYLTDSQISLFDISSLVTADAICVRWPMRPAICSSGTS